MENEQVDAGRHGRAPSRDRILTRGRGQGNIHFLCSADYEQDWQLTRLIAPENLVSRDGFVSPVPRQPAHLHTQAESGAYLRDSSRVPRRLPFMKPPYAIGSVPSLSGHAIAYRWRSLPTVRQQRASKPQGSSERVLPWQVTINIRLSFPQWTCAIQKVTGSFDLRQLLDSGFYNNRRAAHEILLLILPYNNTPHGIYLVSELGIASGCQSRPTAQQTQSGKKRLLLLLLRVNLVLFLILFATTEDNSATCDWTFVTRHYLKKWYPVSSK